MNTTKEVTTEVVKKMDASVALVLGNMALAGFEKANMVAKSINELKLALTDEYMKPIMALQGTKLGFRTDKDLMKTNTGWVKGNGYPMDVVRDCLIEAVLMGLQPTGNQFNIIAGNMYPTKEGCGALLNRTDLFPGLVKSIVVGLPHVNTEKTSAAFNVVIKWKYNNVERNETVPIPIKIDSYASVDAMVGKATRKARAWLLSELLGVEVTDGEVTEDVAHTDVSNKTNAIDPDDLSFQYENKKSLIKDADQKDIERIIKNKEVKSYPKVLEILNSI